MNQEIKIRFNTEKDKTDSSLPAWRVIILGVEHLAESIRINVPSWSTQDEIAPGIMKWHITCSGIPVWNDKNCTIELANNIQPLNPRVIWITGLPAAGKTSLANALAAELRSLNYKVETLDGDSIRDVFPSTGFSRSDRDQHIRRVGYMASRLEAQGVFVIASLISPFEESRNFVKNICKNYFEVYLSTPLSVCESRDPKGLYKKARAGLIKSVTGIDDPYEAPKNSNLIIDNSAMPIEDSANLIISKLN